MYIKLHLAVDNKKFSGFQVSSTLKSNLIITFFLLADVLRCVKNQGNRVAGEASVRLVMLHCKLILMCAHALGRQPEETFHQYGDRRISWHLGLLFNSPLTEFPLPFAAWAQRGGEVRTELNYLSSFLCHPFPPFNLDLLEGIYRWGLMEFRNQPYLNCIWLSWTLSYFINIKIRDFKFKVAYWPLCCR